LVGREFLVNNRFGGLRRWIGGWIVGMGIRLGCAIWGYSRSSWVEFSQSAIDLGWLLGVGCLEILTRCCGSCSGNSRPWTLSFVILILILLRLRSRLRLLHPRIHR
jgi:hypothetical protein